MGLRASGLGLCAESFCNPTSRVAEGSMAGLPPQ